MTPSQQKYAVQRLVTIALDRVAELSAEDHRYREEIRIAGLMTIGDVQGLPFRQEVDLTKPTAYISEVLDTDAVGAAVKARAAAKADEYGYIPTKSRRAALMHPVTGKQLSNIYLETQVVQAKFTALQTKLNNAVQDVMLNGDDGEVRAIIAAF